MKRLFLGLFASLGGGIASMACTGISLTAKDGSYVQARTIEGSQLELESWYVVIPRGHEIVSFTPTGSTGLKFKAKYGVVGMSVVREEFIAEGINEAGLSSGLFFFPDYGGYKPYDESHRERTLGDLQVNAWILSQFSTIDEGIEGLKSVHIVGLESHSVVHWRIGEPSGRQVVMEIVGGEVKIHENTVGVITNSPSFDWHMTNLNNYLHLQPGQVPQQQWGNVVLKAIGTGAGLKALPGDPTPPSRFIRAAFYKATAPVRDTARETVVQTFSILNAFDIPTGIEHAPGKAPPELISDTQWTAVTDLTNRKIYYRTSWNTTIRMIDLKAINFGRVKYQNHPLDTVTEQPIEKIEIR